LEFSTLFFSTLLDDFLVEWEVQIEVKSPGDFLPDPSPDSVVVSAATWRSTRSPSIPSVSRTWTPVDRRRHARKIGIVLHIDEARLAIPDLWGVIETSAEDVNSAIASVAVHGAMSVVRDSTDDTRLPSLDGEELIVDNHSWIYFRLLSFVANGIAVHYRTANRAADLDHVERCPTYWT
jgi:hypothetical protein